TAGVLIVYTFETYKLRVAAQKQIELQQRPFVILEIGSWESKWGFQEYYRVRNIGVGTAINGYVMDTHPKGVDWSCRFSDRLCSILEPQGVEFLRPHRISQDKTIDKTIIPEIEDLSYREFSISIQFSNADMTRYFVSQYFTQTMMVIRDSGPIHDR